MNGTRTTPEGLKRAAEMAQKHGTKTSFTEDTTGLGEYSDAQLLKELMDRGVTTEIKESSMREIKFRYWYKNNKVMSPGLTIDEVIKELSHEIYPNQLAEKRSYDVTMQYTGLKDKNGVEIYEGDVLSIFDPRLEHKRKKSVVSYDNGAFLVDTLMGALPDRTTLTPLYDYLKFRDFSECEVIGNIYENPELLNDN